MTSENSEKKSEHSMYPRSMIPRVWNQNFEKVVIRNTLTNKIPRVHLGKKVTLFYQLINSYYFHIFELKCKVIRAISAWCHKMEKDTHKCSNFVFVLIVQRGSN